MNKILKIALILFGVGGVSAGTWYLLKGTSGSDQLKFIPKESTFVGSINVGSIYSKIDLPRVKKMKLWDKFEKEVDRNDDMAILSDIMQNPKDCGINLTGILWFFSVQEKKKEDAGGMVVPLSSAADFEKLLRKSNTKGGVEKEEKYKYVKFTEKILVGWTNTSAVFYFNDDEDKVVKELDNIMVMEKTESILSNALFSDFKKENKDAGVWFNYPELLKMSGLGSDEQDMIREYGIEDAAGNLSINFDKNDIKLTLSNSFKDKEKSEDVDLLNSTGLSDAHMQNISPDDVFGLLSASINVKKLMESISRNKEMKNSVNSVREELGLSKDEFENLFTGEFSIAVVGFESMLKGEQEERLLDSSSFMEEEPTSMAPNEASIFKTVQYEEDFVEEEAPQDSYESESYEGVDDAPDQYLPAPVPSYSQPLLPDLVITVSAKNPGNLERILKKKGFEKNEKGIYTIPMGMVNGYAWLSRGALVISTNLDVAEKMVRKGGRTPSFKGAELAKSSPICVWADLETSHYPKKVMEKLKSGMGDNYTDFKESMEKFKGFSITGNSQKMEANVAMVEADKNSLMRILELMDDWQ